MHVNAQGRYHFEQLGTVDGLSQKNVQSIFCDTRGFMWFGTWGGLNRYDGREFKVFRFDPQKKKSLTNNRVIDIWQDHHQKIWVKTNDGYIHYLIDELYEFETFPYYLKSLEEKNSTITCFSETSQDEILLGSSNSGLYFLEYDSATSRYTDTQYLNRGETALSSNTVNFIVHDVHKDIWIGTPKGLNHISRNELLKPEPSFSHFWLDYHFTVALSLNSVLYFGTRQKGIITYDLTTGGFGNSDSSFDEFNGKEISHISALNPQLLLIGTKDHGLYIYDLKYKKLENHFLEEETIKKVYKDSYASVWINTEKFGIYRLDSSLAHIQHYELMPDELHRIVVDERQFLYEDSQKQIWIATHGGGLTLYNRAEDEFEVYTHNPRNSKTISSDNIYCLTEDHSGMLWIGAGYPDGGVNKAITSSKAFTKVELEENSFNEHENIVRSLMQDQRNNLWAGTKSGDLYILDSSYKTLAKFENLPLVQGVKPGQNIYTMLLDRHGYIWIGTKGGGVFVSEKTLGEIDYNYQKLRFINYVHEPDNPASLSSNIIYSLIEDKKGNIWIGSYEGGVNRVIKRDNEQLSCIRIHAGNSDLTSDLVRDMYQDREDRLWIATSFGLNMIDLSGELGHSFKVHPYIYEPDRTTSLSYNDVIHIFEDSQDGLWFGTLGGGVSRLINSDPDSLVFEHINKQKGLVNNVVYGVIEDVSGKLWFSTDNGLSRYNPLDSTFDNYDRSSGLDTDTFNENTLLQTSSGELLFGSNDGLLVVTPKSISKESFEPPLVFTNFLIFNKNVDISDPDSPIKQTIETLDKIELEHFQSSFSIEYAALSYFAPSKIKYSFILENFDIDWNDVDNQNKATYTNLSPGKYVFKVRAANWNSRWGDQVASLHITIHPPWWKKPIMYVLYALFLLVVFGVVKRSYSNYLKLQNDLKVEKRVNEIKLQFFTNISHEIRTPLTLILGPIHDILESMDISKSVAAKLHLVEKNGQRMLRLVNQLLDFRKIQQNKMNLHIHKVDLTKFLEEIVENFSLVAEHKDLELKYKHESKECEAWVDPQKFDSVIFNILSNAIKFSPRGGKVEVNLKVDDPKVVSIAVSDKGKGIPKSKMHQLFQRFTPLTQEDDEFGGTGIGLAYAQEIMKMHQGAILVNSEVSKGSVFTVKLLKGNDHFDAKELELSDEVKTSWKQKHRKVIEDEIEEVVTSEKEKSKKLNLLIVEDNDQILSYLKESLASEYNISTCLNGKEGLNYVEKQLPDLIITDLMMPEMGGLEMVQHLKDSIDTSHIPVIMLTAKSTLEDQIIGIESGAEAYILKPFNMTYVKAVISNLLKQRDIIKGRSVFGKEKNELDQVVISSKDEKFLEDIEKVVMENYSDPEFTIDKLVELSYVSRTVFYHKIKSLTGLTPIEFLRQKRMSIAAKFLLESDYNISEVAFMIGYNDTKTFSKRFKQLYKVTPSQYKEVEAEK
ncbi:two-component regulator propeller domain-containing protein [Flammeovirgaceae bacterium SG7u.111]|nr:two-component regulator propeller domain-containing protein [Flammeovirgaceae bacterium SG7u.111]